MPRPKTLPRLRCTINWGVKNDVLCIMDQNIGATVKSEAEAVVDWAWRGLVNGHLQPPFKKIIYQDTDGIWDEIEFDEDKFLGFNPLRKETSDDAIKALK